MVAGLAPDAGEAAGVAGAAGEAAGAAEPSCVGAAAGVASVVAGLCAGAAGLAAGVGLAPTPPSISERWPPRPKPSSSATRKKVMAAPMVIFERIVCVPRGPKAALETELVKSEPASALPGCNSTETTSTTQARMKSP